MIVKEKNFLILMTIFVLVLSSMIPFFDSIQADRGSIPISDADVYGPGQKAIIAWNGKIERLILSTDLYSSIDTKVIEVFPLPSAPSIEKRSLESFQAVQRLIAKNMPSYRELEIIFHEKIEAHEITVLKATSLKELLNFSYKYVGNSFPKTEKMERILEDYLKRGFNYWVFDLVDLASTTRSIGPIVYEFQSLSLYYPMKISSMAKGYTRVILYLITSEAINKDSLPFKMSLSSRIIQFQVSNEELAMIDMKISSLFGSTAWFTKIEYEGELSDLDFDLEISSSNIEPIKCRSIKVNTNKAQYDLRDVVEININYTHLLPGCAEIQVLHYHEVRLEIFDESENEVYIWAYKTHEDLYEKIFWSPKKQGVYTIKASSWWNGEKLEVSDEAIIQVISSKPLKPSIESINSFMWIFYGAILATVCILIGIAIAYFLLKSEVKKQFLVKHLNALSVNKQKSKFYVFPILCIKNTRIEIKIKTNIV
ncbi:MAG: DUF2330 domain-containing protein [Candidatus Bathyarchaeia archaeon]